MRKTREKRLSAAPDSQPLCLGSGRVKIPAAAVRAGIICSILCLQWIQLEFSCIPLDELTKIMPAMILVNLVMLLLLTLVLATLLGSWQRAFWITSPVVLVWSAINYLTIRWHGSPLTFSALRSAWTALQVLDGYSTSLTGKMLAKLAVILALFCGCVAGIVLLRRFERPSPLRSKTTVRRLAGIGGACLLVWGALFSPMALKPARTLLWTWKVPFRIYGYLPCLLEDWLNTLQTFHAPEGYDPAQLTVPEPAASTAVEDDVHPDIILILNETLYDPALYTELSTDLPYLETIQNLPDAIHGYAVVPNFGGGTNNSEYELLTSNSMYLLSGEAPFVYLPLDHANSVVRYAKKLGYQTAAMHILSSSYSREIAYPALGFDAALFGEEFHYEEEYAAPYTSSDRANYCELRARYEAAGEGPRLFYLLTYQNHGGYGGMKPEDLLVHVQQDFGDLTDGFNDYLTRLLRSDEAFAELIAYFEGCGRPVILCMVGDHAPAFLSSLPARPGMSGEEREIVGRSVPFVIWANFPIEGGDAGTVSLVDLVPMTLQAAGLPLTDYYQTILDLQQQVPVRTSYGAWQDANGRFGSFAPGTDHEEPLLRYYSMEYNNLREAERVQALFEPRT